jgi:hypothetical protein
MVLEEAPIYRMEQVPYGVTMTGLPIAASLVYVTPCERGVGTVFQRQSCA